MKKSIVALGAALVAGAAHAVIVQPITNDAVATQMAPVEAGGIGHVLVTPYFSTANGNTTLLSLVNTDSVNGKAVKVRFRGAANSDDILDFTVLMSPSDVWTASVERGPDGISRIIANDTTCVLPWQLVEGNDNSFRTSRLDQARSAEALAMHTQEGYVEYLNMADILPGTPVFAATKHVKNVAPCTQAVMDTLMNTTEITKGEANALGLGNPTGGLFGNWSIFNNANITSYGGGHASVAAVDAAGARAAARLFFSPQTDAMADTPNVVFNTADPLLNVPAGATVPAVDPLWLDLPDLSTPYVTADAGDPAARADNLSRSLAATTVMNEFVATAAGASVPFSTDWVFSQPTRRYAVALNYANGNAIYRDTPTNNTSPTAHYNVRNIVTARNVSVNGVNVGNILCVPGQLSGFNREEGNAVGELSPARSFQICGEVGTLTFNNSASQVLNGQLTNATVRIMQGTPRAMVQAGWASINVRDAQTAPVGVPVLGFAATSFANGQTGGNFGDAINHRYFRP